MARQPAPGRYITVFGSSQAEPGGVLYGLAYALGRGLVESGFGVVSGGHGGTMEAVSRGAREAGGSVDGITVATFDRWHLKANEWVSSEFKASTYLQRLAELTRRACGFVALPGGVGTLSEVSVTWSLLEIGELGRKPLVLLGDCWGSYLETVRSCFLLRAGDGDFLHLAADVPAALTFLGSALASR